MEDKLTLKDKLEKIQDLAKRRDEIKELLDTPSRKLELWSADSYKEIYMEGGEEGLNEYIDDYFKTELEKVDKKLNELLK